LKHLRWYDVRMRRLLIFLIAIPLFSQPPAGGEKKGGAQPHKNLKILTDAEVRPMMAEFTAALGVKCEGCHVQARGNFDSDANPKKDMARTMIKMVREDNANFLAGKTQLTCYTCHRGELMPKTAADAAAPKAN
jgi:Photosynthetic reaction centre cytochrome C subunit